jgi:hypothetical protein
LLRQNLLFALISEKDRFQTKTLANFRKFVEVGMPEAINIGYYKNKFKKCRTFFSIETNLENHAELKLIWLMITPTVSKLDIDKKVSVIG